MGLVFPLFWPTARVIDTWALLANHLSLSMWSLARSATLKGIGSLKRCHQIFIFLECEAFQQLFARRESAENAASHCWWSQGWLMAYYTVNRWSTSAHMRPSIIPRAWRLRAWYASLSLSNWAPLIDSFRSCILRREHLKIKYYYWRLLATYFMLSWKGFCPRSMK